MTDWGSPEVLQRCRLFAGTSPEELHSMLSCLGARRTSCAKGAYLLEAGGHTAAVGLVLSGSILIVQEDFWGNRNLLARIRPGQIFAESFACTPGAVLNVSAVADDPSELLWLDVQRILAACPNGCTYHTQLIRNLVTELAAKNLYISEKLTHMGKRTTRDKLLSYLSAQAQKKGKAEFDIPFSRQQLADYLSVERSAMSAELGRLRDEGLLEFDRSHFILHLSGEAW